MHVVGALVVAAWAFASACSPAAPNVERSPGNAHPLADAGTGTEVLVGTVLSLDAGDSFDPDGEIVTYEWRLASKPSAAAMFSTTMTPTASYTPDAAGTYTFELTVTDNEGSTDTSQVAFIVDAPAITVDAGADLAMMWQQTAYLSGAYSVDPVTPATVTWSFVSLPARSQAVLANANTLTPSFFLDAEGTFVVRLTVTTQYSSKHDDVSIVASVPRDVLSYLIVDAEYSSALDRFVIVSDAQPALHVLDPATGADTVLALPSSPTSVALDPSGTRAAIGHNQAVSIVDLQTLAVVHTYTAPFEVNDLVFNADGRVHCISKTLNFDPIFTINTVTGATSSGAYEDGYSHACLAPNHTVMYAVDGSSFPQDIVRFDISVDPVTRVRADPDHGTYPKGSYIWITADGSALIAQSGNVFYASSNSTVDLTYRANLGAGTVNWAQDSPLLGRVALARTTHDMMGNVADEQMVEVADQTFATLKTLSIPDTTSGSMTYRSKGKYVGIRSDGSKIYVIANAAPSLNALYTFDP
jgi:PKD repeat protein